MTSQESASDNTQAPVLTELPGRLEFIMRLGVLARKCGVSENHIKSMLSRLGKAEGIEVESFVAPPHMFFVFTLPDKSEQRAHMAHVGSSNFDLGKLAKINDVIDQIVSGNLNFDEAENALDVIEEADSQYGNRMLAIGYALSGGGFAMMLNGSWPTILLGTLLSVLLFTITVFSEKRPWFAQSLDIVSALIVALIAGFGMAVVPGIDPVVAAIAGVVVIIPGYTLTAGIGGITGGFLIPGLTRLIDGAMSTVRMFLGGWVGLQAASSVLGSPGVAAAQAQPEIVLWSGVILLMLGLGIIFQVAGRDLPWAICGGLLAYAGSILGAGATAWQGPFVGSLLLGLFGAAFWFLTGRPSSVVLLTGIMVLVPGTAAILGVESAHGAGLEAGLAAEWQTFLVIMGIVFGQIAATTVIPKKPYV